MSLSRYSQIGEDIASRWGRPGEESLDDKIRSLNTEQMTLAVLCAIHEQNQVLLKIMRMAFKAEINAAQEEQAKSARAMEIRRRHVLAFAKRLTSGLTDHTAHRRLRTAVQDSFWSTCYEPFGFEHRRALYEAFQKGDWKRFRGIGPGTLKKLKALEESNSEPGSS